MAAGGGSGETEITVQTLRLEQKQVYFNLRQNKRGRFLKIAEVSARNRSTIIIPESGWIAFRDMLNGFITGEHTAGIPDMLPEETVGAAEEQSSGLQVWVENLPWSTEEGELQSAFEPFGTIERLRINRTTDGRSRGSATIRYATPEEAQEAIAKMNGTDFGGRPLRARLDRFA